LKWRHALLGEEEKAGRRADCPMPVTESEAIVLRGFPLGEGDLLVSFFSRTHGRLRGVAARARRPKSRFGAALEPLSYIRIWFYERETRELVRINQCELIESFLDVQSDYAAALALALASEVTEAVLGEREAADANFRLLLLVARALKAHARMQLVLAYFALWTVRLGGWLPQLDHCGRCGAALQGAAYWSSAQGLICGGCKVPSQRAISQAALQVARRIAADKLERLIIEWPRSNGPMESDVKDLMLDIIEHHIEKPLKARRMLDAKLETAT
jgi:DNA repair protein RecO (recombination protein O)